MSTLSQLLTVDDVRAMPELDERYELIDGEVFVPPAPVTAHQRLSMQLSWLIVDILRPRGHHHFVFAAPYDVRLSPHRSVQPDIIYVDPARADIVTDDYIEGAPDLVMEILSPSTRSRDLALKRRVYAENGVREYWIIDPATRQITLLVLDAGQFVAAPGDGGRFTSRVLPPLVIDQAALFSGL